MSVTDAKKTVQDLDNIADSARAIALSTARRENIGKDQATRERILTDIRLRPSISFLSTQQQQQLNSALDVFITYSAISELRELLLSENSLLLAREVAAMTLGVMGQAAIASVPDLIHILATEKFLVLQLYAAQSLEALAESIQAKLPAHNSSISELVQALNYKTFNGQQEIDIRIRILEILTIIALNEISLDTVKDLVLSYSKFPDLSLSCSFHEDYGRLFSELRPLQLLAFMIDHGDTEMYQNTVLILHQVKSDYLLEPTLVPEVERTVKDLLVAAANKDGRPEDIRKIAKQESYQPDCASGSSKRDVERRWSYHACKTYYRFLRRSSRYAAEDYCSRKYFCRCRKYRSRDRCVRNLQLLGSTWNNFPKSSREERSFCRFF